jgi:hypothetical protein
MIYLIEITKKYTTFGIENYRLQTSDYPAAIKLFDALATIACADSDNNIDQIIVRRENFEVIRQLRNVTPDDLVTQR